MADDKVRELVEAARAVLDTYMPANSAWEAKDQWGAPDADELYERLRAAVDAMED